MILTLNFRDETLPDEIVIEDIDVSLDNENIELIGTVDEEQVSVNIDLESNTDLTTQKDSISFDSENIDTNETHNYSLFFGDLEQKEKMEQAESEDNILLSEINENISDNLIKELENENQFIDDNDESDITFNNDEDTNKIYEDEIVLETEKIIQNNDLVIDTIEKLENSPIVVTDLDNDEEILVNPDDGIASFAWVAIPVGIAITKGAIWGLIKYGSAIIIGWSLGILLSKLSTNSNLRKKQYHHYKIVKVSNKLYSTGGISQKSAISRMAANADVWSDTKARAKTVASSASLSKKGKKTPIGPERDYGKKGYYRHYHTNPRNKSKGHSFYGGPS